MIKKQQQFILKGMNQDIAETKVQPELAYSIKNLRVITDEDSRMLSLVTEKGTAIKQITTDLNHTFSTKPDFITVPTKQNTSCNDNSINLGTLSSSSITLHYSCFVTKVSVTLSFGDSLPNEIDRNNFISYIGDNGLQSTINNIAGSSAKLVLKTNNNGIYYEVYDTDGNLLQNQIVFINDNSYTTITVDSTNNKLTFIIPVIKFKWRINSNEYSYNEASVGDAQLEVNNYIGKYNFTKTKIYTIKSILGSSIINDDAVFFGKALSNNAEYDIIFKIDNFITTTPTTTTLYLGKLNFDKNYPIKTYVSYENDKTIKIYWVDGLNQPRVINITKEYEIFDNDIDNHFNFCTPIYCEETINITKKSIGGFFHSGIIQYFMTYIDQNDQESKIFYQSPIYYITDNDRALAPDENSTNSFVIDIVGANTNKLLRDKLRIYSLQRTSLDAVPIAKLVYELKLTENTSNLSVVDTGNIGMNIDPQILLMLGCEEFIPKTMEVKDQNMFFGNIQIKNYKEINLTLANVLIADSITTSDTSSNTNSKQVAIRAATAYSSNFQLKGINTIQTPGNKNGSDEEIKGFMYNEEYMLGIQFLHKSGDWTEPIWVGDAIMDKAPYRDGAYQYTPFFLSTFSNKTIYVNNTTGDISTTSATGYTQTSVFNYLVDRGYIAARPLVVFNDQQNCRVLCQGIINPTIKYKENLYPSWFFRYCDVDGPNDPSTMAQWTNVLTESQRYWSRANYISAAGVLGEVQGFDNQFSCFNGILTFNSPEVEFEKITIISNNTYKLKAIGFEAIHANNFDIEMLTSTSTKNTNSKYGLFVERGVSWGSNAKRTFVGGYCWKDKPESDDLIYYIYPWENNQSYTCNDKSDSDITYSAPEKKTISNYRYSQYFKAKSDGTELDLNYIAIANQNYLKTRVEIQGEDKEYVYLKDVDLLVTGSLTNDNYYYSNNGTVNTSGRRKENCNVVRIQYKTTPHIICEGTGFIANNLSGRDTDYANLLVCELINSAYNDTTKFKGRFNGKPTETSMYENIWYIAGNTVKLRKNSTLSINWTKGDTYYQRYDCLKTYPYSHEAKNSVVDVLSCMIQTRINLDGRYDKNRCSNILRIDPTNFNKLNDVYSQQDNFFTYHKLDSDRFQNTFPNLVTWGKQKVFGESIDSWTNVHLTNVLDLDGSLGEITALKLWNNKLIAFQQKGIALIKYNENAMIPQASGSPIELMNSNKVSGKEYITNQFGCQNEWSIVNAKSGLYFSDDYNHKLYVLSDGIKCISDSFGFKSYLKTKNYSDVWKPDIAASKALHTFYDQQLGEIYFTDGSNCLAFNENINLFTSFYDYKNIFTTVANPSGNPKNLGYYECNNDFYTLTNDTSVVSEKTYYISTIKLFDFINIENKNYWILNNFTNNTPIFYEHRANDYLNIFGINRDYSIELTSNIDPHVDKIFDTVEIRGDAYINNSLQSGYNIVGGVNTTSLPFDKLQVSNEYQDTGEQELKFVKDKPYSSTSNMKQKFRIWRAAIGRNKKNNQNTRDRIRNYWSRIKLTKNNTNNLRAKIHDIIVNVYE